MHGKCLVESVVGAGGFGLVYRAHHLQFDSAVALKVLHRTVRDPLGERFLAEGKLLFELCPSHPAFVRVFEAGVLTRGDGVVAPYLLLEWLDGMTLAALIGHRRRSGLARPAVRAILQLFDGVACALAVAHRKRVAHRDVKPANLFLARRDGEVWVKILDFGLAKVMQPAAAGLAGSSSAAAAPFTPAYAAPEQFDRSLGDTGPWTDVYALALTMVESLALEHPFGQRDADGYRKATFEERRPTPRRCGVEVSDAVESVFERALALEPRRRFADASSFWEALCAADGFTSHAGLSATGDFSCLDREPGADASVGRSVGGTRSSTQGESAPLAAASSTGGAPTRVRRRASLALGLSASVGVVVCVAEFSDPVARAGASTHLATASVGTPGVAPGIGLPAHENPAIERASLALDAAPSGIDSLAPPRPSKARPRVQRPAGGNVRRRADRNDAPSAAPAFHAAQSEAPLEPAHAGSAAAAVSSAAPVIDLIARDALLRRE